MYDDKHHPAPSKGVLARPVGEGNAATGPERIAPEAAMGAALYLTPLDESLESRELAAKVGTGVLEYLDAVGPVRHHTEELERLVPERLVPNAEYLQE